jgi:hypothetical protein
MIMNQLNLITQDKCQENSLTLLIFSGGRQKQLPITDPARGGSIAETEF